MADIQVKKLQTLTGHRDSVYGLTAEPGSQHFFSAAGDGMIVKWDFPNTEEGTLIARLPNSIYAIHALPGTDFIVAGHNYEGIHVLDWRNKKEVASLKLSDAAIFDIKSFGDDCMIASGDGSLTVIDLRSMTVKKKVVASKRNARTIAINVDRREVAVGYSDNFIRLFDLDDFSLKQEWEAHTNSVFSVAYTPDSRFLLSGSRDARLKVWSPENAYSLHEEIKAHLYAINHIEFSPDKEHFVTCSLDKSVKVWHTASLTLLKVIDKARHAGHGTSVNRLLWSSFDGKLISASDDRTISIWDVIF
ncbi:MAG TPA: WD40 repeat domain-containing protein [Cyclobacteriaceae bacterium]|nr:WD40 repeat domain-containing protein [Cyclobacteriaceae bacterium]